VNEDMAERDVTPNECRLVRCSGRSRSAPFKTLLQALPFAYRLRDLTYSAPVYVDVRYTRGSTMQAASHVQIGRIPIMLRSCKCILAGMSEPQLERAKECIFDPGGYFIVKGVEKVRCFDWHLF
jgi:DNA-directed RNA polymerase beta subunit